MQHPVCKLWLSDATACMHRLMVKGHLCRPFDWCLGLRQCHCSFCFLATDSCAPDPCCCPEGKLFSQLSTSASIPGGHCKGTDGTELCCLAGAGLAVAWAALAETGRLDVWPEDLCCR